MRAAAIAVPTAISILMLGYGRGTSGSVAIPDVVTLPPGAFPYRASGEFTHDGMPVSAPLVSVTIPRALAIMKHQVTAAEYWRCVDAGACPQTDRAADASGRPVVKVSWFDADAYSSWLSRETGVHFRLPTDEEWTYAAASRFTDDVVTRSDPGQSALANYEREVVRQEAIDKEPRPIGSFGVNENGLVDLAGNVWEWTDTCFVRHALDTHGGALPATSYCGIRIAEGRHRAYMIDFVRDARGGGCAVGTPPANLGFRLVLDDDPSLDLSLDLSLGLHSLIARVQHYIGRGRRASAAI
jgi:formylglycine-generating enzyme required for sulfatase activity